MLSKNVVIDGITEYVDGKIILSGGSGQTSGRTVVGGARIVSGAEKKIDTRLVF